MARPLVRVAAVQVEPAFLDLEGCLARLEEWTRKAAAEGATLVAFGETWLPGYPEWVDASPEAAIWGHPGARALHARLMENSVVVPGAATLRMGAVARELSVTLVAGVNERRGKTIYNALLTFGPDGALLNHHRKLVPTFNERLVWGYGDGHGLRAVTVNGVRMGGLICWEHFMPLARQAMHDTGEEVHVAAWPGVSEMHQIASRHYAFEGRCFFVAAGGILSVGQMPPELPPLARHREEPSGLILRGGSAVIAPDGRYLAGPVFDREAVVVADCDLAEIAMGAQTLDVSGHYSRPDVLQLKVVESPARLTDQ